MKYVKGKSKRVLKRELSRLLRTGVSESMMKRSKRTFSELESACVAAGGKVLKSVRVNGVSVRKRMSRDEMQAFLDENS